MAEQRPFLFELGTEELPPKALARLSSALADGIEEILKQQGIQYSGVRSYATPRRLAVIIDQVQDAQEDKEVIRRGPAIRAAFKDDGCPTPAAEGFARSCGVSVEDLEKLETDQGAWLVSKTRVKGKHIIELLPDVVEASLNKLPIPKRMRWGSNRHQFVRPVHWIVMLYGDDVVPCNLFGFEAGRKTRGHRFHASSELTIPNPTDYVVLLESEGHVIPDIAKRKKTIQAEVEEVAVTLGGKAVVDNDLLDEVTALVEWPAAVKGQFDQRYLELPPEVLIAVMEGHQRYFHMVDSAGKLMPYFITVSNIQSKEVARVSAGNERVIRPRLSDAEFFWKRDCEVSLMKRVSELSHVVFQKKLGSVSEKVDRVTQLASHIARQLNESVELVERAAQLAKADLMTEMVGEFPELQGVMGHYYAQVAGENPAVIHAMDNHYRPRFGGDAVASDAIAYIVAIADKLDTIVGIFGVGQIPTGEKDPFALRRAALGVQRTLIENRLPLDLAKLIEHSIKTFKTGLLSKDTPLHVFDYMMERLRSYYSDQGIRPDEFESVREIRSTVPFDFHRRINAVHEFRKLPQAESLAAANKRCRNILRKSEDQVSDVVDISLFEYDEEKALYQALEKITEEADEKLDNGDYEAALEAMAQLKDSVDAFFDTVLVMAEDERIRKNRLGLLSKLGLLFLKVADISHLQS